MDTISLTLGHEELLFLLHLLKIPALAGLDENSLTNVPTEQINAAMVSAERSLYARGFIQAGEEGQIITIYSPVIALLASCATAEVTLMVAVEANDQPLQVRYYHVAPYLTVERSFPRPGIHRFVGGPEFNDLSEYLRAFLRLDHQPRPVGLAGNVTQRDLEEARSIASCDQTAAVTLLQDGGVPEITARELAKALGNPMCAGIVTATCKNPDQVLQGFGVVVARHGVWLITPKEQDESLDISPASAEEATRQILAIMDARV